MKQSRGSVKSTGEGLSTSRRDLLRGFTGVSLLAAGDSFGKAAKTVEAVPVYAPPPAGAAIVPFRISVPQAQLDDLRQRVRNTRWPDREVVADTSQGVQLAKLQALSSYWATSYDWRGVEQKLNALTGFRWKSCADARGQDASSPPTVAVGGWDGSGYPPA